MKTTLNFEWYDDFTRWDFPMSIRSKGLTEIISWIGADIEACGGDAAQKMIQRLRGIKVGQEKKGYIGTGNAHSILAFDQSLYLRCEFDDDLKVILPIDEAINALVSYVKFKSGDWRDPNCQPEPFTVSYDYEGAEAEAHFAGTGLPWGLSEQDIAYDNGKLNAMDKKGKKRGG
ncbi:hypothetical protein [Rhodoferax sp. TS-BS-61-7]|uniref:hypothetical protein n=1 Tax=Rhodoferax sp. TS-BS-61-7 TaxID=2094194 RepID=UPI0011AFDC5D|nr:hypothetical protein [Rhodoferax sp. TS-BS-61-7]